MLPLFLAHRLELAVDWVWSNMGGSENRGPEYSTLNSRILIIRTPKYGTLIFGNSHIGALLVSMSYGN